MPQPVEKLCRLSTGHSKGHISKKPEYHRVSAVTVNPFLSGTRRPQLIDKKLQIFIQANFV